MDVVVKALSLVSIIVLGHVITRRGWVRREDFAPISRIVLRITLPCALVTSFDQSVMPLGLLGLALVGVVVNLLLQVAGFLAERHHGRQAQAFAVLNCASFNMGAFATPYLAGFMGPAAVVHASLFDLGNSFAAAGIGFAWGSGLADEHRRTTWATFVRTMFSSVIFDVYLALLVMKLLDLHLPAAVLQFTSTVGAANTFLAMLMIGIGLEFRLDRRRYRSAARHLGLRYLVVSLAAVAVWCLPVAHDLRVLLVVVLFAPIAAMTPGFTAVIGGDVALSTFMASVSIVVGIVAMPVLLALL